MTNTVHITGRLGRDPHAFPNGGCVLNVADERDVKDGDGWKKITEWHQVFINPPWIAKYAIEKAKKGANVSIRGELQYRQHREHENVKEARIVVESDGKFEIIWPPRSE